MQDRKLHNRYPGEIPLANLFADDDEGEAQKEEHIPLTQPIPGMEKDKHYYNVPLR